MRSETGSELSDALRLLDYAFQPIVNIHTGVAYGYEALLRDVERAGFSSIGAFFDNAHHQGVLNQAHQQLFIKALNKFYNLPWADQAKLFYNLDGRLFGADFHPVWDWFAKAPEFSVLKGGICLEISERHDVCDVHQLSAQLEQFRSCGCRIAVDDYGTGYAGSKMLYFAKPEYVKIDRFYVENIENDTHKRMLAANMVSIAHLMGSLVVAEGVETSSEYYFCRAIGCDLVQGYLVQKPELDIKALKKSYDIVQQLANADRRSASAKDKSLIQSKIEHIEPIHYDAEPIAILDAFKNNKKNTFFPVINRHNEAIGIIREETVKQYAYSQYGRYLLTNPTRHKQVEDFISRIPIVDIYTSVEGILDAFTAIDDLEGIIITKNLKYVGILRAQSLLRIVNEKKIATAIDQNPLTGLPGNKLIYEYVSRALQDNSEADVLVYFDFDNFKVYNDSYGFRQGDRVILLFSELLKASAQCDKRFVGHIGGDDFVMGLKGVPLKVAIEEIICIGKAFSSSVESFYESEAIRKGCLQAIDRDGQQKCFPLMSISAAILELPAGLSRIYSPEEIGTMMAKMKKEAKRSPERICVSTLKHFENIPSKGPRSQEDTVIELSNYRNNS